MASELKYAQRSAEQRESGSRAADLLAAVAAGDRQAFAELYTLFSSRVYGIARTVLRDQAEAEEVSQEVFLAVWRNADRFDPARGSAAAWLSMITHSQAVTRVRQNQASRNRNHKYGVRNVDRGGLDPVSDATVVRFEHEQIRAALHQLSPLQRQALAMAFYGDKSYPEVSRMLELPLGTIKSRIHDGLSHLKKHIMAQS